MHAKLNMVCLRIAMCLLIGLQPIKTRAEHRVRLVDGLIFETHILQVSPVNVSTRINYIA